MGIVLPPSLGRSEMMECIYQIARRHMPEAIILGIQRCGDLKYSTHFFV